jgi:hypothetical protein
VRVFFFLLMGVLCKKLEDWGWGFLKFLLNSSISDMIGKYYKVIRYNVQQKEFYVRVNINGPQIF